MSFLFSFLPSFFSFFPLLRVHRNTLRPVLRKEFLREDLCFLLLAESEMKTKYLWAGNLSMLQFLFFWGRAVPTSLIFWALNGLLLLYGPMFLICPTPDYWKQWVGLYFLQLSKPKEISWIVSSCGYNGDCARKET